MTRRRRRAWVGVALLSSAVVRGAEGAPAPACASLAVSEAYATDHTVACYTYRRAAGTPAELKIWTSRDGMRSWQQAAATGVTTTENSLPGQFFFAAGWLFLQVSDRGLLASNDLGATFQVVDPLGSSSNGMDNLTPAPPTTAVVPPGVPAPFPAVDIAYGDPLPDSAALIRPPVHQRAVGSTDADLRFAAYADAGGARRWLALAERRSTTGGEPPRVVALWDCDALLTCTTHRHDFRGANAAVDVTVGPGFGTTSSVVFATTRDIAPAGSKRLLRLWRSADSGRSFTEVAPVLGLLRAVEAARVPAGDMALGVTFVDARTVVLRVEYDDTFGSPRVPVSQFLVSSDAGATWRLVAYRRSAKQGGPRGTLPWNGVTGMTIQDRGRVHYRAGRLFVLATKSVWPPSAWCSRDLGRTWAASC